MDWMEMKFREKIWDIQSFSSIKSRLPMLFIFTLPSTGQATRRWPPVVSPSRGLPARARLRQDQVISKGLPRDD